MIRRFVALASVALGAAACHFGANAEERDPGTTITRTYQIGAFDKIAVAGPYEVTVTTGSQPGASASGGDKLLDETEVVVEEGTLKIRPKKRGGLSFSWGKRGKAQFTVSTAMLRAATIGGSGGIKVDQVDGDFEGRIGGSGDLALAAIKGGAVDLTIGGSGTISAAGTAQSTDIKIGGSGSVDASGLIAKTASVAIGGSGDARVNASDSADVKIAGSGDVVITGGAKCEVRKAGSGNATCG